MPSVLAFKVKDQEKMPVKCNHFWKHHSTYSYQVLSISYDDDNDDDEDDDDDDVQWFNVHLKAD